MIRWILNILMAVLSTKIAILSKMKRLPNAHCHKARSNSSTVKRFRDTWKVAA